MSVPSASTTRAFVYRHLRPVSLTGSAALAVGVFPSGPCRLDPRIRGSAHSGWIARRAPAT